jgi:uncharacterized protein YgiB involved in biofilm formation
MRRAKQISIAGITLAVACFTGGCGHSKQKGRCVLKSSQQVVDQRNCDNANRSGIVGGAYGYYYGGGGRVGQRVSGGTAVDPADRSAVTSRGGFGSHGKSGGS